MEQENYWTIRAFAPKLRHVRDHVHRLTLQHAHDPRRTHAYQEFTRQANHDLDECNRILQEKPRPECREVLPSHFCSHTEPPCYELACFADQEAHAILRAWVREHAHKSYYLWKEIGTGKPTPPIDDPNSWEVVCADQDHVLLSHPLLHHPNDFLIYQPTHGARYADKARFAYQFPNTLSRYSVLLTKKPSHLPKLIQHQR